MMESFIQILEWFLELDTIFKIIVALGLCKLNIATTYLFIINSTFIIDSYHIFIINNTFIW